LEAGTWYFTSRRFDPSSPAVAFSCSVDPKSILSNLAIGEYYHGEENEVLFFGMVSMAGVVPIK
jgi:hypothetical protein